MIVEDFPSLLVEDRSDAARRRAIQSLLDVIVKLQERPEDVEGLWCHTVDIGDGTERIALQAVMKKSRTGIVPSPSSSTVDKPRCPSVERSLSGLRGRPR